MLYCNLNAISAILRPFWDPLRPFRTIFGHIAAIFLKFDGHCCNFLSFSATLKAKKEHLVVGILKKRSIRPSFWDYGHFADTLLSILSCNLIQGPPTHVTMVFLNLILQSFLNLFRPLCVQKMKFLFNQNWKKCEKEKKRLVQALNSNPQQGGMGGLTVCHFSGKKIK